VFNALARLVNDPFAGVGVRPHLTALYLGRKAELAPDAQAG
jgi:hypothetical protein